MEAAAKEALERMIAEKQTLSQQLDELRAGYANVTDECSQVYKANDDLRVKIMALAEKNQELGSRARALEVELDDEKKKRGELEAERDKSQLAVHELSEKTNGLNAQIELLSNEKEAIGRQVQTLVEQLEQLKKQNMNNSAEMPVDEMETRNVQTQLELAYERIEELENELSEKTRLVNELLLSKDDILNSKFKELMAEGKSSVTNMNNTSSMDLLVDGDLKNHSSMQPSPSHQADLNIDLILVKTKAIFE